MNAKNKLAKSNSVNNGDTWKNQLDTILMEVKALMDWTEGVAEELSNEAAPFLFQVGKIAGRHFATIIFENTLQLKDFPGIMETFFLKAGWKKLNANLNFDDGTPRMVAEKAQNTSTQQEKSNYNIVQGYVSGVSDVLSNAAKECTRQYEQLEETLPVNSPSNLSK